MRTKARLPGIALGGIAFFAGYAALLCVPQPLFPFTVRAENLILHSDRPFSETAGRQALALAEKKLARSPLYSGGQAYHVFLCNSGWRQAIFFNKDYGAGGVAQYPVTPNVFLRGARVEDDRLISPSGNPVPGDRTLDYYVAHEITHQLTGQALGPIGFLRLPRWVREGYADYVGKGNSFDYGEARRAFLAGRREMDWKRSGQYGQFHLLVAYLLDHRHWSVERLLRNPPAEREVQAAIRREEP